MKIILKDKTEYSISKITRYRLTDENFNTFKSELDSEDNVFEQILIRIDPIDSIFYDLYKVKNDFRAENIESITLYINNDNIVEDSYLLSINLNQCISSEYNYIWITLVKKDEIYEKYIKSNK